MTKRVEWVDIAKYVCIMCVMASHLDSMTGELRAFLARFSLHCFSFVRDMYIRREAVLSI